MTVGYSFEDDDDVGREPWALGADEAELVDASGEGDEFCDADRWLDEQLGRPRPGTDPHDPGHELGPWIDNPIGDEASQTLGDGGGGVVLRRPATTRPPRRRLADPDAVADLPTPTVPGYVRDRRGTWRYAATGQPVPGARDLTLRALYRFSTRGGAVLVPLDLARTETDLGWCLAWKHTLTTALQGGRVTTVLKVPVGEWERRADIPIGLWAPELTASRLLGIAEVARLVGATPTTITAYLARRRMPPPVNRIGNSPVWTRPIIQQWLASRPGQGARARR